MGPLRLYEIFNAMKLHWTSSYDFVKYKGKLKRINRITLDQSKDKAVYYQLNKKYKNEREFIMTLIPLFLENSSIHCSSLLSSERTEQKATEWYRKIQNMSRSFASDSEMITRFIKDQGMTYHQFFLGNPILDFLLYNKINIETFIILDRILFFLTKNPKNVIMYNQVCDMKVQRYNAFINVDTSKYRNIFEKAVKKTS